MNAVVGLVRGKSIGKTIGMIDVSKSKQDVTKSCCNCKWYHIDYLTIYHVAWCFNPDSKVTEIANRKYCMKFEPSEELLEIKHD